MASIGAASILKKEAMENKDEPRWIYIDEDRLSKVESFLLKHSVLSQQLYGPKNQQHIFQHQPFQAYKPSQGPSNKIPLPGSSTSSHSQTQGKTNPSNTGTNTQEFWQDSEIVKEQDFSTWEISPASNVSSEEEPQKNADSLMSANSSAPSPVVRDIFNGSPWKLLSTENHKELNKQLLQEFSHRQNMLESRLSWFSDETKKLPVASHR